MDKYLALPPNIWHKWLDFLVPLEILLSFTVRYPRNMCNLKILVNFNLQQCFWKFVLISSKVTRIHKFVCGNNVFTTCNKPDSVLDNKDISVIKIALVIECLYSMGDSEVGGVGKYLIREITISEKWYNTLLKYQILGRAAEDIVIGLA